MKNIITSFRCFRYLKVFLVVGFVQCGILYNLTFAAEQVGLYDVWEMQVVNKKSYSNPFNFNEIEIQTTFMAPSGKQVNYFGFYDGDGNRNQTGDVWKIRFMPDELGTWTYSYSWTDGTVGASGSFEVITSGLGGPLRIASDNPKYFMTLNGSPFHARPYDLHHVGPALNPSTSWDNASSQYINVIQEKMIQDRYNMGMVDSPSSTSVSRNYWWNNQKDVFDVAVWNEYEKILDFCVENQVYIFPFDGMVGQEDVNLLSDVFLRYLVARFGAYYSYMGYSPTYEWTEVLSTSSLGSIMTKVNDWHPFNSLLSAHDYSSSLFTGWMDFSMRQMQSRTVFDGNCRGCGQHGGVDSPFDQKPIIGSEDIWEMLSGANGQPRNATEVRRGAWGSFMAGILPLYSEWHLWATEVGNMPGELEVRRMFDFCYSQMNYRNYMMLNSLVSASARQVCSGISGQEYLVYDEDGGSITIDLTEVSPFNSFSSVLWFDPKTGLEQSGESVNGGSSRTFNSPFTGDSVLLLSDLIVHAQPVSSLTPSLYQIAYLRTGDEYYIDRGFTLSSIPDGFNDVIWIKTANNDKMGSGDDFMAFDLAEAYYIGIGYDSRIATIPDWLESWTLTSQTITDSEGIQFKIYSKLFDPGRVVLGANYGINDSNMYIVLIQSKADADEKAPAAPTGLVVY